MAKFPTDKVIKVSAYITAENGYTKRSDDPSVECTADQVFDAIIDHSIDDFKLEKMNDRITAWSNYIRDDKQKSEYISNVRSEIVKPMIDESKIGLIASSFAYFDRHISFQVAKEKDKQSEYLGEEGDSVSIDIAEYKLVKTGTSKFGKGNKWYLYKLKDTDNNCITVFSNDKLDTDFKHHKHISAIVSKLSEYEGVKQTQITRITFE